MSKVSEETHVCLYWEIVKICHHPGHFTPFLAVWGWILARDPSDQRARQSTVLTNCPSYGFPLPGSGHPYPPRDPPVLSMSSDASLKSRLLWSAVKAFFLPSRFLVRWEGKGKYVGNTIPKSTLFLNQNSNSLCLRVWTWRFVALRHVFLEQHYYYWDCFTVLYDVL